MNKKNSYYLLIFISLIGLVYIFKNFLTPILLSLVFSIVCSKFLHLTPVKSIKVKSLLMTLLIAMGFVIPFSVLISLGANESLTFINKLSIQDYLDGSKIFNNHFINKILKFLSIPESEFNAIFNQTIVGIKQGTISKIQSVIYEIPAMLFSFSLMISSIYFMLVDGRFIKKIFYKNFIYDSNIGNVIVKNFTSTSVAIMVATLGSAIVQTTVIIIPTLFINFDNALLIAFGIFIFSMIPIIGTVPIIAMLVLYHLSLNQYWAVGLYVSLGFIVGFIDSILKAMILQRKVKINPFIALLSTFAGVQVFGIFGLILGPIIIITLLKLLIYTLKQPNQ